MPLWTSWRNSWGASPGAGVPWACGARMWAAPPLRPRPPPTPPRRPSSTPTTASEVPHPNIQLYNLISQRRNLVDPCTVTKHSHARLGVIDSAHLKRILCLTSPKLHKELQTPNISDFFKDVRLRIKPDTWIWLRGLFCVLFCNRGLDMFKISRYCCTVVNSPSYGKSIAILVVQ